MNDFTDLEAKLKSIRPAPLQETFIARVEQQMADPAEPDELPADNVIRPNRFRIQWVAGLGLAAAAALFLLVRVNFQPPTTQPKVALTSPEPTTSSVRPVEPLLPNTFLPAGTTQVVYQKRDEGLLFAQNAEQPMRRLRSVTRETLQWKNPATGASLQVSYPSEQVELVPISAQ